MSPHHTQSSMFTVLADAVGDAVSRTLDRSGRLFDWVDLAMQVRRERRDLARLDERMLKDIGLDNGQAWRETSRDFADLPRKR